MKKLLIFITALSFAACTQGKKSPDPGKTVADTSSTAVASTEKMTLNGIPYDEAKVLVQNFLKDTVSSDEKTNVWFSKAYIENIEKLLTAEKADGIRIYFAKKDNKKNTVVIVSTRAAGPYPCSKPGEKCSPSGKMHQDYFEHNTALRTSLQIKYEEDYGTAGGTNTETLCNKGPCSVDESYVSCSDVKAWIENFKGGEINIKSVWYSINIIRKLKKELAAPNEEGKYADGVRLYFTKNYKNKNGFAMVTTMAENSIHRDYYDCHNNDKLFDVNNHGEECPVFCAGTTTWE